MKRLRRQFALVTGIMVLLGVSIHANDPNKWKYSKELSYANEEEIKSFYLDEEVYKYMNQTYLI